MNERDKKEDTTIDPSGIEKINDTVSDDPFAEKWNELKDFYNVREKKKTRKEHSKALKIILAAAAISLAVGVTAGYVFPYGSERTEKLVRDAKLFLSDADSDMDDVEDFFSGIGRKVTGIFKGSDDKSEAEKYEADYDIYADSKDLKKCKNTENDRSDSGETDDSLLMDDSFEKGTGTDSSSVGDNISDVDASADNKAEKTVTPEKTDTILYNTKTNVLSYSLNGSSLAFPTDTESLKENGWTVVDDTSDPKSTGQVVASLYDEAGSTCFLYHNRDSKESTRIEFLLLSPGTKVFGLTIDSSKKDADKVFKDAESRDDSRYQKGEGQITYRYGDSTAAVNFASGKVFSCSLVKD